jgi:hypothetical protein
MTGIGKTLQSTVSTIHMGLDGFVWWMGVVEDRADPLHLGRARVRIHSWHTDDKTMIPTDHLPWAHVLHPVNGTHGSVVPPKEGTMVMGYFMDGKEGEFPIIMGIFHGIPEKTPDASKGFSDPGKDLDTRPSLPGAKPTRYPDRLNEPHTPRLARNEDVSGANTYIDSRNANCVSVTTAAGGKWSEPKSPYAAKYPYNVVVATESGHITEHDDTPGAERINTHHRSGTYEELQPDGSRSVHVYGSDYHIVVKDHNVYVKGTCNINVDGDANILVGGDNKLHVKGDAEWTIDKNLTLKVGKALKIEDGGAFDHTSTGNMTWTGPKYDFK